MEVFGAERAAVIVPQRHTASGAGVDGPEHSPDRPADEVTRVKARIKPLASAESAEMVLRSRWAPKACLIAIRSRVNLGACLGGRRPAVGSLGAPRAQIAGRLNAR